MSGCLCASPHDGKDCPLPPQVPPYCTGGELTALRIVRFAGLTEARARQVAAWLARNGWAVQDPRSYETPTGRAWRVTASQSSTEEVIL